MRTCAPFSRNRPLTLSSFKVFHHRSNVRGRLPLHSK